MFSAWLCCFENARLCYFGECRFCTVAVFEAGGDIVLFGFCSFFGQGVLSWFGFCFKVTELVMPQLFEDCVQEGFPSVEVQLNGLACFR